MAKTITLPSGLGTSYTYMNWNKTTNTSSPQYQFRETARANGQLSYDSQGYAKVNGRYVVALTSTFGDIGDYVDIQTADGTTIHGVIGEQKSQTKTWYDQNPANKWGHNNGQSVVEFLTNWGDNHQNPTSNGGVVSITNLGSDATATPAVENMGWLEKKKYTILYNIVVFVVIAFLIVVAVWFFAKAFDLKIGGILP